MLAGELYDALDPELVQARERARDLCHDLNASRVRNMTLPSLPLYDDLQQSCWTIE